MDQTVACIAFVIKKMVIGIAKRKGEYSEELVNEVILTSIASVDAAFPHSASPVPFSLGDNKTANLRKAVKSMCDEWVKNGPADSSLYLADKTEILDMMCIEFAKKMVGDSSAKESS